MPQYTYEIPDSLPEDIQRILREDIDATIKERVSFMQRIHSWLVSLRY